MEAKRHVHMSYSKVRDGDRGRHVEAECKVTINRLQVLALSNISNTNSPSVFQDIMAHGSCEMHVCCARL